MKPVQYEELLSLPEYATQRDRIRPAMIALRTLRRLHVGEHMTLHFENRDTVYYQVQEMLRAEHITERKAIEHELETYNELVPASGELSATLMIEYATAEERARELKRLLGLDRHLWLVVGGLEPCLARFDRRQFDTERLSSVQFIKFPLPEQHVRALTRDPAPPVLVRVDHAAYGAEAFVPESLMEQLQADLES
jgi:hypothetical protein